MAGMAYNERAWHGVHDAVAIILQEGRGNSGPSLSLVPPRKQAQLDADTGLPRGDCESSMDTARRSLFRALVDPDSMPFVHRVGRPPVHLLISRILPGATLFFPRLVTPAQIRIYRPRWTREPPTNDLRGDGRWRARVHHAGAGVLCSAASVGGWGAALYVIVVNQASKQASEASGALPPSSHPLSR